MASIVYVVDSTARRTQVKVSPQKTLREVLEEACASRKLNPASYTLKVQDGKKTLDLATPFRLSGLSPGAKLTLVQGSRSPSVVTVALQLPESEGSRRIEDKFPSTTSLWLVLRKFEDDVAGGQGRKLNLTQRGVPSNPSSGAGRLEYEQPCLSTTMGNSWETFADLQKPVSQVGSGRVLVRLTFKNSGQPLEEAMKEIERYFSAVDTVPAGIGSSATQGAEGAHAAPPSGASSLPDAGADNAAVPTEGEAGPEPAEPAADVAMDDAPTAEPVENDVIATSSVTQPQPDGSSEEPPTKTVKTEEAPPASNTINGMSVYLPPSSSTPAAAMQEDDPATYEPSIDHAKSHQANLQRAGRNQRLLSDKELEEQENKRREKLALVQNVNVRLRYPDQSTVELTCTASETAADLYAKVQGTLAQAPEPYELRYTGEKPHQLLPNNSSKRLVKDFGFRGSVLVTVVWSPEASTKARTGPSLNEEFRSKAQALKVQLNTEREAGEAGHRAAMAAPEKKDPGAGGGGKGNIEDKMKKFLGFGKKK